MFARMLLMRSIEKKAETSGREAVELFEKKKSDKSWVFNVLEAKWKS